MLLIELFEGGWTTTVTQGTVIHPSTVKKALAIMEKFVADFNVYAKANKHPTVKVGHPTGSSAYHDVDPEDKIYGDIDLQIVVPELKDKPNMTTGQVQYYWNKQFGDFVKATNPNYVHPESTPGHPILKIGDDAWVQIDMMPHPEPLAVWGRYRATPERGVKGMLNGNMFAVIGEMLMLNLQHSGVQYKEQNGRRVPYAATKKDYELKTITTNVETFVRDIFDNEYKDITYRDPKNAKIDPLLIKHPGSNLKEVKISNLVNAVKGMARSFELNGMYGKGILNPYANAEEFLNKFIEIYMAKAQGAIDAPKRDKAETPEAKARADADKKSIAQGAKMVQQLFANNN
jgi:hypothetical protein